MKFEFLLGKFILESCGNVLGLIKGIKRLNPAVYLDIARDSSQCFDSFNFHG